MSRRWPTPSRHCDRRVSQETAPGRAGFLEPAVFIPFAIVTLIWGSTWLVIRDQLGTVPPSWSVCYRFLVAAAGMFALAAARKTPIRIGGRGLLFAAILGTLQFCGNFNLVYRAEQYVTSGVVAVIFALLIVPNTLLGWISFRHPVARGFLIGSAIAIVGLGLLFLHEYHDAAVDPGHVVLGLGLTLTALLCASVANVMQGTQIARQLPMLSVLAWAMLIGALVDGAFAWATVGPPVIDPRPGYMAGTLYLALAGSVVTFPLYFRLIQKIGPGRAAYSSVLIPIIAMLLSTLFEGYRWSLLAAAGAALALVGMVIAMRARSAA